MAASGAPGRSAGHKPQLIVDKRQDKRFTAALQEHFTIVPKVLVTGDFLWSCPLGTVGVEDKAMNDLADSRRNGRLDDELRRLTARYMVPILFVRGTTVSNNAFRTGWEPISIEKLLFGRQLHGAFVWRAPASDDGASQSLRGLYDYLGTLQSLNGFRREATLRYRGSLSPRAEVIYGILGRVGGIRGRLEVATTIATGTTLAEFLQWTQTDFTAAGFSPHMANKLASYIRNMEATHGTN